MTQPNTLPPRRARWLEAAALVAICAALFSGIFGYLFGYRDGRILGRYEGRVSAEQSQQVARFDPATAQAETP